MGEEKVKVGLYETGDSTKGMTTQVEDAAPCPSERAGVRTTEFWLAVGMLLLSAYLASKGKDELATVLAGIAGTVYTGFRGLVKSKLAVAGMVLMLAVGCGAPGYVKASEIQELTHAVCDRHDTLVRAKHYTDAEGGAQRQQSDLRSSEILVGTVDEAVAAGKAEKASTDAETKREYAPRCPEYVDNNGITVDEFNRRYR